MSEAPGTGTTERELTEAVRLCRPDGQLDRAAVGWSRRPLHDGALTGSPLRKKRWDYWCVTAGRRAFVLLYADLDYFGLAAVRWFDLDDGVRVEATRVLPLAIGSEQPDTVAGACMATRLPGLSLSIDEEPGATRLRARARTRGGLLEADLRVAMPEGHETLNVVVPWSDRRFQFTSKHNTRPTEGFVRLGDRRWDLGGENEAFGCLDFGRGKWPYRSHWNWASASGRQGDRVVGINLGGRWTDGTGMTENGLCIDGRLSKISDPVDFLYDRSDFMRPWRIRSRASERVRLSFTPVHLERLRVEALVAGARTHQCFGHFQGTVVTDDGESMHLDGLFGWAEEMIARW